MIYIKEIKEFDRIIKESVYEYLTLMYDDSEDLLNYRMERFNKTTSLIKYHYTDLDDIVNSLCDIFEEFSRLLIEKDTLNISIREQVSKKYLLKINSVFTIYAKELSTICINKYRISKKDNLVVAVRYKEIVSSVKDAYGLFISDIYNIHQNNIMECLKELDVAIKIYIDIINNFCNLNFKFVDKDSDFFIKNNLDQIDKFIKTIKIINNFNTIEFNDLIEDKIINISNNKVFDYKEMEKIAKLSDYEYKWSNGSHRVYEHKNSKKIIVIPSHELGLGLSKKIQKQIINNSF